MDIEKELESSIIAGIYSLYGAMVEFAKLEATNQDFAGDYTFVTFPILRISKKKPEETAQDLGDFMLQHCPWVSNFNVVKGFLNLEIKSSYWQQFLEQNWNLADYGKFKHTKPSKVMVEYSSPNTNKPLHLGHVRNNLLGYSVAEIMVANGYDVVKANLINDRGIHICKSMLAWQKFGNEATPKNTNTKGDTFVGSYYVRFDQEYKKQIQELVDNGVAAEIAGKQAPLILEAQEMLRKWEAGDADVLQLWNTMNSWVYEGFASTYNRLGVNFDTTYYESKTYTLGKDIIAEGLAKNVFYKKEDGSVWIDLTSDGLDHKLVLRSDGTSVYMTQDIGTAELKFQEFGIEKSIYVVGNEQDYHFKVLFLILQKLGKSYAAGLHHLSYGMVDLPSGKMKSREGTVVDADDLLSEMHETAKAKTIELGKTEGLAEDALENLYESLGLAALKFYILKVDPRKRMLFNPEDSIDFHGDTGPFVLYTYARIQSVLRQAGTDWETQDAATEMHLTEKETLQILYNFPKILQNACQDYSPALLIQYCLDLAKAFNRIYNELPLLKENDASKKALRLKLAFFTAQNLKTALQLVGIKTVERM